MARINVDDSFFADPRFRVLVGICGDDAKAIGMCVQAWSLAQRYWTNDRTLIPESMWTAAKLETLITVELAERRPEGIYCRGSEKQFDWLVSANRVRAGKRSAEARRKKYGTALPKNAPNQGVGSTEQVPNKTELSVRPRSERVRRTPDRTEPNSLALSLCDENAKLPKGGDVWEAYRAAYFARYGREPVRNKLVNSNCKQLVDRLGGDAAVAVVRFFLTHPKRYYVDRMHDLRACVGDAEALHTQMLSGRKVTSASADESDRQASNAEAMKEAMRILEARDEKE